MAMHGIRWRWLAMATLALLAGRSPAGGEDAGRSPGEGRIALFDGKSLEGWKAGGGCGSFDVRDGTIVLEGAEGCLFYAGPLSGGDFQDFELSLEARTSPGASSGVFFHTASQDSGPPRKGLEVLIHNACRSGGDCKDPRRTGSLCGIRNVYVPCARDATWFALEISVRGRRISVRVDGKAVVDFTEPDEPWRSRQGEGRTLSRGAFALRGPGPGGTVSFRNILARPLPASPREPDRRPGSEIAYQSRIAELHAAGFPLVDFHVHLKGGLTLEEALRKSLESGIDYGIAQNCGIGFPVTDDEKLRRSLQPLQGAPVFRGMQAEGREWLGLFSREAMAEPDYILTDGMTFTDDKGRRTRLWIDGEVHIDDEEKYMDLCVDRIVGILEKEPIDIYANATFLPARMAPRYDRLWTPQRMDRVIGAAVKAGIAIEINARYRIPSAAFIRRAKKAGAKFTFGTNNGDRDLGRLEYCLEVIRECGLTRDDMFLPKPGGRRPR